MIHFKKTNTINISKIKEYGHKISSDIENNSNEKYKDINNTIKKDVTNSTNKIIEMHTNNFKKRNLEQLFNLLLMLLIECIPEEISY